MDNIMKYKGYYTKVNYSSVDNCLFGRLEGIEDIVLFDAQSISEFKEAFEGSVDAYLESCEEFGKSPQKTYSGNFNVRIPSGLHREIAEKAMLEDESVNSMIEAAIRFFLQADVPQDIVPNSWDVPSFQIRCEKEVNLVA